MLKVVLWMFLLLCDQALAQPSVAFFYGKHAPILQLCTYDIIVADPSSNFNPNDCKPLSKPIAYVSVGEVAKDAPYEKKIRPEWVIGENTAWNKNKIIDQTQKDWQTFFIKQLIEPLWNQGYRGFFLDTLDSYFLTTSDPKLQQKQIEGMVSLIQRIKQQYPDAKIILNRGFTLLPYVQSQIYAVAIESLYHGWYQKQGRYKLTPSTEQSVLLNEINKIHKMNLPIIVIDYLPPSEQKKAPILAEKLKKQGLIPWITDKTLQKIYIKNVRPVSRKILILFSNETKLQLQFVPALRYLGSILEYMGYVPVYHDLSANKAYPKHNANENYAGIILWLDVQNLKFESLLTWLQQHIKHNIPVVFLRGFGVPPEARLLKKLNLTSTPIQASNKSLQIKKINPKFIGYDVAPPKVPYTFFPLNSHAEHVLLQVQNEYGQTEDAVAITPWGGYALSPYVIQILPEAEALWIINPFRFLKHALRLQDFPIPDTTTENGRRLLSVHIDGDGFTNQARWAGGRLAAEELRERILKKYRIPTSFSVVTGEIAPNGANPKQSKQLIKIARSICALPWVEVASHSFSHPFNWQKQAYHGGNIKEDQVYALKLPHYTFDLKTEIDGSINFINQHLMPKHKKAHLFFWSGLANPSAEALQRITDLNLLAINGLSSLILDSQKFSIANVRPMGVNIGNQHQVYPPFPMDFNYMHSFEGPLYGFENVIKTAELTDKPRRLKPIDLYYHIYAASYPASLKALHNVYHWALKQPVMNIYISEYIKKVHDYYRIRMGKYGASWVIFSKGDLRELRSLNSLGYPDLAHSHNVIGFYENKHDMYIHLGPNRFTILKYQKEKPKEPYLVDANARVTAFSRKPEDLTLKLQGHMPLQFSLANTNTCHLSSNTPLHVTPLKNQVNRYSSSEKTIEIHIHC